ncbi:MAG: sulfatase [Deltaproteobacteria bacterium]|nr:sulfatase [Deltaproteobacteria bacterium]
MLFAGLSCAEKTPATIADLACKDCNVLLITVDALRADALPCYGGKKEVGSRICSLAENGILFERAHTFAPLTWPALDAIMTGATLSNESWEGCLAALVDRPSLAELLGKRGYATAAFTAHPALDLMPDDRMRASSPIRRGFDVFRVVAPLQPSKEPTSKLLSAEASAWLEQNRGRRFFLWTHFFDTHAPYLSYGAYEKSMKHGPDACGDPRILSGTINSGVASPREVGCLRHLYLAAASDVDEHVGRILDTLAELGLDDRTMIILTADHGEELMEHGGMEHGDHLFEEAIRVPLLVRTPSTAKRAQGRVREIASTPSIFKMVLDATGGRCPVIPLGTAVSRTFRPGVCESVADDTRGITCFSHSPSLPGSKAGAPKGPIFVFPQATDQSQRDDFALVKGDVKVILPEGNPDRAEGRDLFRDPGERRRLPALRELRDDLLKWIVDNRIAPKPSAEARRLAKEREEQMKALGYIKSK